MRRTPLILAVQLVLTSHAWSSAIRPPETLGPCKPCPDQGDLDRYRCSYDDQGRLTAMVSPAGRSVRYDYHLRHNKVWRITHDRGWIALAYTRSGELERVEHSDGSATTLDYDAQKQIVEVTQLDPDGSTRSLHFAYNRHRKPTRITLQPGGEALRVTYAADGITIKKVRSTGPAVAGVVSAIMAQLLRLSHSPRRYIDP